MDKEDKEKKDKIKNILSTSANIVANSVGPWFPGIPVVASIISSISDLFDKKHLADRLNQIEEEIYKLETAQYGNTPEQAETFITKKINNLNSHDYFSFKRKLRYLIADTEPEVVDTFVSALLSFLHDDKISHTMDEEVMDILVQFNAHDIELMENVERYRNHIYDTEEESGNNPNTFILEFEWNDFVEFLGYKGKSLEDALTEGAYKQNDGNYSYDFSYLGRSLLKLQSLGVFSTSFNMYVGNSSITDIKHVSITQFGNEILKHIAYVKGWPQRIDPKAIFVAHK